MDISGLDWWIDFQFFLSLSFCFCLFFSPFLYFPLSIIHFFNSGITAASEMWGFGVGMAYEAYEDVSAPVVWHLLFVRLASLFATNFKVWQCRQTSYYVQ